MKNFITSRHLVATPIIRFCTFFIILATTTTVAALWDIVRMGFGSFDLNMLSYILRNSFVYALVYTTSASVLFNHVLRALTPQSKRDRPASTVPLYFELYFSIAVALTFFPVRSIFQKAVISSNDFYVTSQFVAYDFLPLLVILITLGVCFTIYAWLQDRKPVALWYGYVLIPLGIVLSFHNLGPNFDARILEARGYFHLHNYRQVSQNGLDDSEELRAIGLEVSQRAERALMDAQTDKEKGFAWYWIGLGYSMYGDFNHAVAALEQSAVLSPNVGYVHMNLAEVYARLKRPTDARKEAESCHRIAPNDSRCYWADHYAYWGAGQLTEARDALRAALAANPKDYLAKTTLDAISRDPEWTSALEEEAALKN